MIDESSLKAVENVLEKIAAQQNQNNPMPKIPRLVPGQGGGNLRDKIKEGIGKAVDKLKSLPQKGIPKMSEALSEEEQGKHIMTHAFKTELQKTAGGWDWFHGAMDVAGMIPVVGAAFDGVNALTYAARGQMGNAALSATAMIPGAGQAATAAKLTNKAIKAGKAVKTTSKAAKGTSSAAKTTAKVTEPVATVNKKAIKEMNPGVISGRVFKNSKTGLAGRQQFTNFGADLGTKTFNKLPAGDFKSGLADFYKTKPGFGLPAIGRTGKAFARFRGAENTIGQGLGLSEGASATPFKDMKEGVQALPTLAVASKNYLSGKGFTVDGSGAKKEVKDVDNNTKVDSLKIKNQNLPAYKPNPRSKLDLGK